MNYDKQEIFISDSFKFGVKDAAAGLPFRMEYEYWPTSVQVFYEYGRQIQIITQNENISFDDFLISFKKLTVH